MKAILSHIWSLRGSVLAFLAAAGLSVLSLGYLSFIPYLAASPILRLFYPPIWEAKGPWLWPVLVGAGILWSFSFLVAGGFDAYLKAKGRASAFRWAVYLAVLWLGAIAAWGFMLHTNAPPDGFRTSYQHEQRPPGASRDT